MRLDGEALPAGRRAEAGRAFHGLHLDLFELNGNPTFPITFQPSRPLAASFENGLSLLGYDLQPVAATTSDSLKLTLYWRVDRRVDANLIVFTQLLNRGNHIYAQHDKPPVSELYKTSQWAPGDLLRDEYLLPIKAGAPPGEYRLLMGLYDRDGMKRVPVSREGAALADHLPLTGLSLARGVGSAAYQPANPLALTLAEGVQLLGYEVEQQELHPGDTARIAFYWRAPATPGADYEVALALRDSQGNWHAQRTAPVVDGAYPSTAWQPGELVRDVQELALGAIPPGIYTLAAQLQASGTAPSALLDVGQLLIK